MDYKIVRISLIVRQTTLELSIVLGTVMLHFLGSACFRPPFVFRSVSFICLVRGTQGGNTAGHVQSVSFPQAGRGCGCYNHQLSGKSCHKTNAWLTSSYIPTGEAKAPHTSQKSQATQGLTKNMQQVYAKKKDDSSNLSKDALSSSRGFWPIKESLPTI